MSERPLSVRSRVGRLPILSERAPASRLEVISRELRALDDTATREYFGLEASLRMLKTTASLCPDCLDHVPAVVFVRGGGVYLRKSCTTHGRSEAVLENDATFYYLSNKDRTGRCFAPDRVMEIPPFASACCDEGECGPGSGEDATGQMVNKTCTILVEATNACNLACPVCYSDARGDRKLPLEAFKTYLLRLIEQKNGLDSVQLTGGEALLHPEIWEMVSFLHAQRRVKKVYLPTNGIQLARADVAERLRPFRDKLLVLLQFDGPSRETNTALRGAQPRDVREQVIAQLERLDVPMQLTMTVSAGVNEHEIGWVVDTGMRHRHIKVIALQPATYAGRYDLAPNPLQRATLSDVAKAVARQAHLPMGADDFVPIPCSHPNCGWITIFVRRFGLRANVRKYIDLPRAMGTVAYKTLLSTDELRGVVGQGQLGRLRRVAAPVVRRLVRSTDMVSIAIKPFMDRFSYDQDRIANCCHHLMDTKGRPVSFCEYNARIRADDTWSAFPTL